MQKISKNKMVSGDEVKTKQEYFFSGGGEYLPQTVEAESPSEAERTWAETRKKVESLEANNSNQ